MLGMVEWARMNRKEWEERGELTEEQFKKLGKE